MGLDMYANKTKRRISKPVDFDEDWTENEELEVEEIAYWRKFNNLHGWMEKLYREKGGEQEFNCTPVQLTAEDLDKLESDAKLRTNLDPTSGFFFGAEEALTDTDVSEILEFVEKARAALAEGYNVFYTSWW